MSQGALQYARNVHIITTSRQYMSACMSSLLSSTAPDNKVLMQAGFVSGNTTAACGELVQQNV